MAYESGAYLPAKWQLDTTGTLTVIKVMNDKMTEKITELVKKLAGNAALPERYGGFKDFEATIKVLVDSSALPTATGTGLGFRAGNKGTFYFPVGTSGGTPNNWFTFHAMILQVDYDNPVDDLLSYEVKVALDVSSGSLTYPT